MKNSIKKYKWWSVLIFCAVMVCACEKQQIATSSDNPISFGSGRTHATSMSNANAKLWGYFTDATTYTSNTGWVFVGGSVDTDGWVVGENAEFGENGTNKYLLPAVTKYWADNQTYNFYSVQPVVDAPNTPVTGVKFKQTTKELSFYYNDINSQVDLCIAAAIGEQGNADRTTAVNLTYKHALSKVQFRGHSSIALEAKLSKLEIEVPEGATAQFTLTADTKEGEGKELTAYAYDFTKTNGVIDIATLTNEGTFTLPANPDKSTEITGTEVAEWLVFPKTIIEGEIKIRATYLLGDGSDTSNTKTVETAIPATTWQPGKRYIYDFYIQPSGPITFGTYEIREWEDGGSVNITMK